MTLNRARLWGIALTTIGVILAIMVSFYLTTQLKPGDSLLGGGLVGFILVAPFILSGVYQFWRGSTDEIELNAEMPAQRELMDMVRARPVSLAELATKLQLAPQEIRSIIEQLHELDLFHGYRTPEGQLIYVNADTMDAMTRCAVCGAALAAVPNQIVTCPKCKSDYYM